MMSYNNLLNEEVRNVLSGYVMDSYVPKEDDVQKSTQGYVRKWVTGEGHANFPKTVEGLNVDSQHFRCWTRRVILIPGQTIHSENVILKSDTLSQGYKVDGFVSLHHKNQLIRSINTMIDVSRAMLLEPDANKLPTLMITVTHVKIIISRSDANKKCDPELENDDEKFLWTVIEVLGCIPVFWKDQISSMFHSSNISFCTKASQYQRFWDHFNSRQNNVIYGKYTPSCNKVSLTYDISTKSDSPEIRNFYIEFLNKSLNGDLLISIDYKTEEYEKVISQRYFDSESLFSQVGGLIGIMVGVSFINIPSLLEKLFLKAKEISSNMDGKDQCRSSARTVEESEKHQIEAIAFNEMKKKLDQCMEEICNMKSKSISFQSSLLEQQMSASANKKNFTKEPNYIKPY